VSLGIPSPGGHLDKIRVVLADDNPRFGDAIRSMLGGSFHVVGAVSDGQQAMIAVLDLDPDLLITDLSMPYLEGLQLAHELKKASCRTKIIMLTMHNESALISAALDAGVLGYVLKARLSRDLVPAVNEVLNGNTFVSGFGVIQDSCRAFLPPWSLQPIARQLPSWPLSVRAHAPGNSSDRFD
jgi:DNA-binding NarL/FixJ family response regulator